MNEIDDMTTAESETKKRVGRSHRTSKSAAGDGQLTKPRADVNREYFERREQAGDKRVTVWLSSAAREALARLKGVHGSNDAAVEACLLHCDGNPKASEDQSS